MTEKEFLESLLPDLEGQCIYWACAGPTEPYEAMATCCVCATVQAIRERIKSID